MRRRLVLLFIAGLALWFIIGNPAVATARTATKITGVKGTYSATGARITGRLLRYKSGRWVPLAGRSVYLTQGGVAKRKFTTNSSGRFVLSVNPRTDYALVYKGSPTYRPAKIAFRVVSPAYPDPRNTVYAVDSYNNRVQAFNRDGYFLFKFGTVGSASAQFRTPFSIARDGYGNVYVTDASNNRIQKFTSAGAYLGKFGTYGHDAGQFSKPEGIVVDKSNNNVYVVDMNNQRVQQFTSGGTFVREWGQYGSAPGMFSSPSQIAIDRNRNIYVVDSGNDRIQKFTNDGRFLATWGTRGSGDGQFGHGMYGGAWGIAIDASSTVYVADYANYRVQSFDTSGTYLYKWGSYGSGNGQFRLPCQVSIDTSGGVYVGDVQGCRVQKFDRLGTYLSQWGGPGSGNGQFAYSPQGIAASALRVGPTR